MVLNSDASRARVLSELYRLADVVDEQDDFLLYYAGHGVRNRFPSRKTFWLTYDDYPRGLSLDSMNRLCNPVVRRLYRQLSAEHGGPS